MNTPSASTAESVRSYVMTVLPGEPFSSSEFMTLGTRAAVDQALSRLTKEKVINRVTRGVYVKSVVSKFVGTVTPEPFKIAQAVARATGAKVSVNGAEAARGFSLSTQMSTQSLFLTTGPSRVINVGKSRILLRHTSERKLGLAGTSAGMALSALYYLGKEEVTPEVVGAIAKKLTNSEFEELRTSTKLMPSWMSDAIYQYAKPEPKRELVA